MPSAIQRIGVLTGGGDCPGLNAVIRAVTKSAILHHQLQVLGIEDGYLGLIENRIRPLANGDVSNILTLGGTILGSSNKADPAHYPVTTPDGSVQFQNLVNQCVARIGDHGIDALIVIGGDGTMAGAMNFVKHRVNCIGVPKTIDNDLPGTDVTFGFASARAVASDALDRIHTTAASHHRVMIVEVMGRNAGWIALHAGIASGADVILIPEIPFQLDVICEKVHQRSKHGKRFSIICAAEGAVPQSGQQVVERYVPNSPDPIRLGGIAKVLGNEIEDRTGIETRTTVLGHVQRGGTPVPEDRVLATEFGHAAVETLMAGKQNRLIVKRGLAITDIPLDQSVGRQRLVPLHHPLIAAARAIGTSFGDTT